MSAFSFDVTTFTALIDGAPDVVIVVDRAGIIRFASGALPAVLGHDPDDLIGQPYELLVPDHLRAQHRDHHRAFMDRPAARPMGRELQLQARHRDGHDVQVEIALVPLPGEPTTVAACIRDVTVSRLSIERLAATNELMTLALEGADRQRLVESAVTLARHHLRAFTCWLAEIEDAEMSFVVAAADGHRAEELLDQRVHLVGDRPRFDDTSIASRLGLGPAIAAPIAAGNASLGMLALARPVGERDFGAIDREALQEFSDAVAVTLQLVDVRSDIDDLRHVAERDRIARDLHDTVIQRLFAISLRLDAVVSVSDGIVRERLIETVDEIDEVIREIRTTIFNLQHQSGPLGIRRLIAEVVEDAAVTLGFGPTLLLEGPLDALLPAAIAQTAPAVVREALSNVARHAHASNAEVTARLDDTGFSITVVDDGIGPPPPEPHGTGLDNLRARAAELGGHFELRPRPGGGTIASWIVPLDEGPVA